MEETPKTAKVVTATWVDNVVRVLSTELALLDTKRMTKPVKTLEEVVGLLEQAGGAEVEGGDVVAALSGCEQRFNIFKSCFEGLMDGSATYAPMLRLWGSEYERYNAALQQAVSQLKTRVTLLTNRNLPASPLGSPVATRRSGSRLLSARSVSQEIPGADPRSPTAEPSAFMFIEGDDLPSYSFDVDLQKQDSRAMFTELVQSPHSAPADKAKVRFEDALSHVVSSSQLAMQRVQAERDELRQQIGQLGEQLAAKEAELDGVRVLLGEAKEQVAKQPGLAESRRPSKPVNEKRMSLARESRSALRENEVLLKRLEEAQEKVFGLQEALEETKRDQLAVLRNAMQTTKLKLDRRVVPTAHAGVQCAPSVSEKCSNTDGPPTKTVRSRSGPGPTFANIAQETMARRGSRRSNVSQNEQTRRLSDPQMDNGRQSPTGDPPTPNTGRRTSRTRSTARSGSILRRSGSPLLPNGSSPQPRDQCDAETQTLGRKGLAGDVDSAALDVRKAVSSVGVFGDDVHQLSPGWSRAPTLTDQAPGTLERRMSMSNMAPIGNFGDDDSDSDADGDLLSPLLPRNARHVRNPVYHSHYAVNDALWAALGDVRDLFGTVYSVRDLRVLRNDSNVAANRQLEMLAGQQAAPGESSPLVRSVGYLATVGLGMPYVWAYRDERGDAGHAWRVLPDHHAEMLEAKHAAAVEKDAEDALVLPPGVAAHVAPDAAVGEWAVTATVWGLKVFASSAHEDSPSRVDSRAGVRIDSGALAQPCLVRYENPRSGPYFHDSVLWAMGGLAPQDWLPSDLIEYLFSYSHSHSVTKVSRHWSVYPPHDGELAAIARQCEIWDGTEMQRKHLIRSARSYFAPDTKAAMFSGNEKVVSFEGGIAVPREDVQRLVYAALCADGICDPKTCGDARIPLGAHPSSIAKALQLQVMVINDTRMARTTSGNLRASGLPRKTSIQKMTEAPPARRGSIGAPKDAQVYVLLLSPVVNGMSFLLNTGTGVVHTLSRMAHRHPHQPLDVLNNVMRGGAPYVEVPDPSSVWHGRYACTNPECTNLQALLFVEASGAVQRQLRFNGSAFTPSVVDTDTPATPLQRVHSAEEIPRGQVRVHTGQWGSQGVAPLYCAFQTCIRDIATEQQHQRRALAKTTAVALCKKMGVLETPATNPFVSGEVVRFGGFALLTSDKAWLRPAPRAEGAYPAVAYDSGGGVVHASVQSAVDISNHSRFPRVPTFILPPVPLVVQASHPAPHFTAHLEEMSEVDAASAAMRSLIADATLDTTPEEADALLCAWRLCSSQEPRKALDLLLGGVEYAMPEHSIRLRPAATQLLALVQQLVHLTAGESLLNRRLLAATDEDEVAFLCKAGANPFYCDPQVTPSEHLLTKSCREGHAAKVRLMLAEAAGPLVAPTDFDKNTHLSTLDKAVQNIGDAAPSVIRSLLLLNVGWTSEVSDVANATLDTQQATLLHRCAMVGAVETSAMLIEHGANCRTRDLAAKTPLHIAVEQLNFRLIAQLEPFFEAPLQKSDFPRDALHRAARRGMVEALGPLIGYGFEINDIDGDGLTALHVAETNGRDEVVTILKPFTMASAEPFLALEETPLEEFTRPPTEPTELELPK
eukprot:TRINITY_DN22171_c0_g1_i1.p1 TRINITY_DN22171_c0_g1~~TRINITY_DN22171_c0_g1_i1.p1  ORF type:complete len:1762 (+),score=208.97 TRINITY_DN22171_c0_g1_i1:475-5286(+)